MSLYMDNKSFISPTVTQHGSHMVMSNVMKPTKTKCVNIDTKFCDEYVTNLNNNSNSDFTLSNYIITLSEKINNVKSMKVESVEIPNVIYNISSSQGNNYFKLTTNGVSRMIKLRDGYYTNASLNSEINSLINPYSFYVGLIPPYNLVGNYKVFFFSTSNTGTIDFAVSNDGNFDKNNFKFKLGWILGFRNMSYSITNIINSTAKSNMFGNSAITTDSIILNSNILNIIVQYKDYFISSENFLNLNTANYLYLIIDEYCNGKQNSFYSSLPNSLINKNIIAKIIINKSLFTFGDMITATHSNGFLFSDYRNYNGKIDIQKLNLQLVNENGEVINLNGFDFSISLKLEYE